MDCRFCGESDGRTHARSCPVENAEMRHAHYELGFGAGVAAEKRRVEDEIAAMLASCEPGKVRVTQLTPLGVREKSPWLISLDGLQAVRCKDVAGLAVVAGGGQDAGRWLVVAELWAADVTRIVVGDYATRNDAAADLRRLAGELA